MVPKTGPLGPKNAQKLMEIEKPSVARKLVFSQFRLKFCEGWGCPGGGGGPYEEIPSNCGRVWSYKTWGKSIFMFLGDIGNSHHHQIPPKWSSGLQIGPRIFWGSGAHDTFWEWRTRYFLGVAHTMFSGSGAHDTFWEWRTRYCFGHR